MEDTWQKLIQTNDYKQIAEFYETKIDSQPDIGLNYHYLGLALLLQGREEDAQLTWFLGLENVIDSGTFLQELGEVLKQESIRREKLEEYQQAWLIRHHLKLVLPEDFDNLVQLVYLSLQIKSLNLDTLYDFGLIELVESIPNVASDNSLFQLFQNVMYAPISCQESLGFITHFLHYVQDKAACIDMLTYMAVKADLPDALALVDVCLNLIPKNIVSLGCAVKLYIDNGYYAKAIEVAKSMELWSQGLYEQIAVKHVLLEALMSAGGKWDEAQQVFDDYQNVLEQIVEESPLDIPLPIIGYISLSGFFATYFRDNPTIDRTLQNKTARLVQANIQQDNLAMVNLFQQHQLERKTKPRSKKLKIGYLSNSLRQHSIGWLARSLIEFHDREKFEIYAYFPASAHADDILQKWYVGQFYKVFREGQEFWGNQFLIAKQIDKDEIDILVDLESATSAISCSLMAQKTAPIQVTWLGWDASSLPAIDYYIADPYVLPEDAQNYYTEKIWRLPQTYIAVNGFNYSLANLHRRDIKIPEDAIIYFSAQKCYKRHPASIRLQMQILKQVPNSYFVIKGLADENAVQDFFGEIAEQEGVSSDRLRFLGITKSEAEHRANLAIADVVLDTYPYNGATTTMEVLWMGIPLVTKVGTQFVSRNSYTMMMNAGITEGIAWTDSEYVEWGVRFGTEIDLRRDVAWKLRESRKTSPLWDGRQFAREMEKAYQQMWDIYSNG
jgi:predicted O-linked N-acetylglucosamine transferase (SPINDLY family)